jgi:hypothetical protein
VSIWHTDLLLQQQQQNKTMMLLKAVEGTWPMLMDIHNGLNNKSETLI